MDHTQQHNVGYDSTQQQQQQQQQQPKPSLPNSNTSRNVRKPKPYVKIVEQPASKALRFRYECEGRSAGSIPGVNSTSENKTYPTIEIVGYKGRAVVVVSCVTKDEPYRPHPHNLVGKEGCKKGVCTIEINSETMRTVFSNLGIQCVKKKDIEAALKAREEIRVDPFKTGFQHRFQPSGIDLNSVRLCFQVFMEGEQKGRFTQPLPPVVSEPIYDKKAMSDLVICRLCSCSASVLGNNQIILLCEKVAKEDISIRFFEEKDEQVIWEGYGDFQHTDVHKQTAITFKTPRYHKLDITEPAKVFIQLKRPSDGVTSEALPFQYIPLDSDPAYLKRKRQKSNGDPIYTLLAQQPKSQHQHDQLDARRGSITSWNQSKKPVIKTEPRDTSPQPFNLYHAQHEVTQSPHSPLSPCCNYNQPSPYGVVSTTTALPIIPQVIGQYKTSPNSAGATCRPSPNSLHEYNVFNQQTQHTTSNFTGTSQWESKFSPNIINNNETIGNDATQFRIYNALTAGLSNANANRTDGNCVETVPPANWPLPPVNLYAQMQHYQANPVVVPPCNVEQMQTNNNNNQNNHNNSEQGLSNLLNFDSTQLVRIDTEDQQMLQLNTEDLQISNLSIST